MKPGFFDGRILLNLDSEDEGELFIGCAGGIDTVIEMPVETRKTDGGAFALKVTVKGLQGGHSGDDINKGRGNAIKILNRFLWEINEKYGVALAGMDGGNLRNAIAREAFATIVIPEKEKESIRVDFNLYLAGMEEVWKITEPGLKMKLESADLPDRTLTAESTTRLLNALYACPHGVFSMSYRMPGMVETSTNLASVKFKGENTVVVTTSQRSDITSEKMNIAQMVASVFKPAQAKVVQGEGYPGWTPDPDSAILKIAVASYKKLFGKEPVVRSIHAGLECGLLSGKKPDLDCISFGPNMQDVHSFNERLEIASAEKIWNVLKIILKRCK